MAQLMDVEMQILKACQVSRIRMVELIGARGAYLRQLAHGVINGHYQAGTAARLLLNY